MSFEPTGFSAEIFRQRYAFTETETWQGCCERVAHQIALAEDPEKQAKYEEKFYDVLVDNLFVPGGRVLYNAGRPNPNLLNCFALSDDLDSSEGWAQLSYDMIVTSMKHGGCGINFSSVRPKGAEIKGQKGLAPGPMELMKLINASGHPIKAGGQRRVALMFALDLQHPQIEEFIQSKVDNNQFDMANISVISRHTTDFIREIEEDGNVPLSWKNKYRKHVSARDLWGAITANAYNQAEPGFLNWELVESESNTWYINKLAVTNPCGEIALEAYGSCCLGHLVLPRFIDGEGLNWELMADTIRTAVRFLDNVLTVNCYPLPQFKEVGQKNRRIGLGTTGLADMLVMLGYQYGSDKADEFVDKLYRFISKQAYEESILLAIEKGAFPSCDPVKHVQSGYVKRMTPKIKALIKEHGIRNCAVLTQAPTGTVSILSGNCSSGIEPVFAPAYERRWYGPDNEIQKELVFHPLFVQYLEEGRNVSNFIAAHQVDVEGHLRTQATIQRHVDNAVSKTVNLAKDYPLEDLRKVWLKYLPLVKGCTFYRTGSRNFGGIEEPLKPFTVLEAVKMYREQAQHVARSEVDCSSGMCTL